MFYPPIYCACLAILIVIFLCVRNRRVELLILFAFILVCIFATLDMVAHGGEPGIVRDASGKIITRSTVAGRTETVRDANGKITEVRDTRNGLTTVRDASGKILRTERGGRK